jgi:ABC-type transport system substrate-binding protein
VAFVPDPTTAVQLLGNGLVDAVAPSLGISWGRRLAALPGVETSSAFGPDLVHLVIEAEAVTGLAERLGIAGTVDRSRFVETVIRGEGRPANGVLAPEQTGARPTWRLIVPRGVDARASPAAPSGEELSLAYSRGELLDILARFVQGQLREAGIDVELVPLESDVFQGVFLPARRYDLALVEHRTGPAPDLSAWFEDPDAGVPLSALQDPRMPDLEEAWDRRGSEHALAAAQRRLASLSPVLPLFQPRVTMAWREGVRGPQANPTADGPLWNAWAWAKS